jgi:hypothetical protein
MWALDSMRDLKARFESFRKEVIYGDPLCLKRKYGKGTVIAFLTTAGTAWNEWAGGGMVSWTYPMMMFDLQKYLTSGGDSGNRLVGDELRFELDATRYKGEIERFVQKETDPRGDKGGDPQPGLAAGFRADGRQFPNETITTAAGEKKYIFTYKEGLSPSVRYFRLFPLAAEGVGGTQPEERWYAFNVDTAAESNLRRASKEALTSSGKSTGSAGQVLLFDSQNPNIEVFRERQADLSESPWLYLLFLLILVVEQALAVHLSFHLKGQDAAAPVSSPAPSAAAA